MEAPPLLSTIRTFVYTPSRELFRLWLLIGAGANWVFLFTAAVGAFDLSPRQIAFHGFFFVPVRPSHLQPAKLRFRRMRLLMVSQ
jgi:hypothetical protein